MIDVLAVFSRWTGDATWNTSPASACLRRNAFRQVHDGHCTYMQPGEEAFVTPEAIHGTCVAGTPEEIAHQLTQMERNGLTGISLLPPAESQRKVFRTSPKW